VVDMKGVKGRGKERSKRHEIGYIAGRMQR
jgi:hypothetical protein